MSTNYFTHSKLLLVLFYFLFLLLLLLLLSGSLIVPTQLSAQQLVEQQPTNNVVIELFYRGDSDQSLQAKEYGEQLDQRPGIEVKSYDILKDSEQLKRLWQLSTRFGYDKARVPSFYLCDRMKVGFPNTESGTAQIEEMLTIRAYIRPGCKHCKAGKEFLDQMVRHWPGLTVQYYDVVGDLNSRIAAENLAAEFQVQVPSFPLIKVAERLVVGFQTAEITGTNIESLFQDRSVDFPGKADATKSENAKPETDSKSRDGLINLSKNSPGKSELTTRTVLWLGAVKTPWSLILPFTAGNGGDLQDDKPKGQIPDEALPQDVPLPDDFSLPDDVKLPDVAADDPIITDQVFGGSQTDEIEVPWLGRLSVGELGLPAFTFLIGLVDGFNPCAMWVLVFLLSMLVNIKDRKKILIVAGTFVVVSGLAYFVFMAAWFSVFQLIGLLRPVQIVLGVVAIIVGSINVKDFFLFHKGISLSIPDSAKPGIYRRVREIISANHLSAALVSAITLAIVVNIIELLCTAGLPALYTEILTMQNLPAWENYAYLALYIVAYMLDDSILVIIVVCTLSHRRLQESEGRWLKLLSGLVILALGVVMIFWPDILI